MNRAALLVPGDPATRTGGYIYDAHIVEGLRDLDWQVDVLSLDSSFPQPTPAALGDAQQILAAIPDERIVIIDGLALGGLASVLESEAERLRVVALIHHPLALETGLDAETARKLKQAERDSLVFARRVIVTSSWTSRALLAYGLTPDRIRVVEPGVDAASTRELQAPHFAPDTVVQLLCVATLTPRKGHAVLIEALSTLHDDRWVLRCAGSVTRDTKTYRTLQTQIERLNLGSRIQLLGEIDDAALEHEYAQADVFILPSFMEGYGMALADALAHGLPVISTLAGAIPETAPANAGLLVEPGDPDALARALKTIMDPQVRRQLTENAIAAGRTLPKWETASRRFADALEDLAGSWS